MTRGCGGGFLGFLLGGGGVFCWGGWGGVGVGVLRGGFFGGWGCGCWGGGFGCWFLERGGGGGVGNTPKWETVVLGGSFWGGGGGVFGGGWCLSLGKGGGGWGGCLSFFLWGNGVPNLLGFWGEGKYRELGEEKLGEGA